MRSRACLLIAAALCAAWVTSVAAEEGPAKARVERPSRALETIQRPEPSAFCVVLSSPGIAALSPGTTPVSSSPEYCVSRSQIQINRPLGTIKCSSA